MIKNLEQIEMKEVAGGQNYDCVCTKPGAVVETNSTWATGCALYCCKLGTYIHWIATSVPGGGTFGGQC